MKNILVPTDFSDLSDFALNLAAKLAQASGSKIHALKVVSTPGEAVFDKEGKFIKDRDFDSSDLEDHQQEDLRSMEGWAHKVDLPVQGMVEIGRLDDKVTRFIDREQIDLVVMGTHGARGAKELIAGSVAGKIVQKSPVPVLTLKCDRSDINFKDIILAGSYEWIAQEQLDIIKEIQRSFGATLHLLRINTPTNFSPTRATLQQMDEYIGLHQLEQAEKHVYCAKDIAQGILDFAQDYKIDLIAMGTHNRSNISRIVKRSTTKKMVNHAFHPILTYQK